MEKERTEELNSGQAEFQANACAGRGLVQRSRFVQEL
jgi:hypothetical protein